MPVIETIQLKRGSASDWTAANPILLQGEPGFETDTGKFKIGDGVTLWAALAYQNLTGPTGAAGATGSTGPQGFGLAPTYLGYNTVGGTAETITSGRWILKPITPSVDSLLLSIGVYVHQVSDTVGSQAVAVWDDKGGTAPTYDHVIAMSGVGIGSTANGLFYLGNATTGYPQSSRARWVDLPCPVKLTASAQYWIGCMFYSTGTPQAMYYDSSGTDRKFTASPPVTADGGRFTDGTDTRKYSIRALVVPLA